MTVFEYIIGAILIVFSVLIIIVVLLQEGNEGNVGVISGSSDTFMESEIGPLDQGHRHHVLRSGLCRDADDQVPRPVVLVQQL